MNSRGASNGGVHEVDTILLRVRRHFGELLDDDSNPLELALALMDGSSIGKARYADEFQDLRSELKSCLKQQVDANYQGFNSSVGIYHAVADGISESHNSIAEIKSNLNTMRQIVKERRPMLKELQQSSLKYKQMLELLDLVEELKSVPDKLEEHIAQKRFLDAHTTLTGALETIINNDLVEINAIQPIHSYIASQQVGLFSTLVEELSAHVYLRSPYTLNRWTDASVPKAGDRPLTESMNTNESQELIKFLAKVDQPLVLDHSLGSVEEDSFTYIRLLVETFVKLNRLEPAIEEIQAKLTRNIRRLVDKTISEFIKKNKISIDTLKSTPFTLTGQLDSSEYEERLRVLEALTVTLLSKFTAVLEAHRVIYEVVNRTSGSRYDMKPVYAAVETEVRSLLVSYIDEGPSTRQRGRSFSSLDSRRSAISKQQAKSENIGPKFQFAPETMDPEMSDQFNQLKVSMKRWVPGLGIAAQEMDSTAFTPFADTHKESNLSVVAPANVRNMSAMAPATGIFWQRAHAIAKDVPELGQWLLRIDNFLQDFMSKIYIPRLKNAIGRAFDEIIDADSAKVYPNYKRLSQLPLLSTTVELIEIVYRLCLVISSHQFRDSYSNLLVSLAEDIRDYFKTKVDESVSASRAPNSQKLVYALAVSPGIRSVHTSIRNLSDPKHEKAILDEIHSYILRRHGQTRKPISQSDLLDLDAFEDLALLSTSMKWAAMKLLNLRVSNTGNAALREDNITDFGSTMSLENLTHVHTVLNSEQLGLFDKVVASIQDLANVATSVLRCDIMCRIVFYFDQMATSKEESVRSEAGEQDSYIDLLQRQIVKDHQIATEHLVPSDGPFIFAGIAKLVNELLIFESENIQKISDGRLRRMFGSILSLQQALKSVVANPQDVDFTRSVEFYESLRSTPARVLDSARNKKTALTENDIKLFLDFKRREDLAKKERDETILNQSYNEHTASLQSIFHPKVM